MWNGAAGIFPELEIRSFISWFDPDDSLATAARSHLSGKFKGIPCEVSEVQRLENNWYTVLFYTDTSWDRCG